MRAIRQRRAVPMRRERYDVPAWGDAVNETVIYKDTLVTVTTARAVIQDTTYAMANITSVRHFEQPANIGCLVAIGGVIGVVGVLSLRADTTVGILVLLLAGIVGGAAWIGRHPTHWVRIGTAGAEADAISSHDREWTRRVVEAINTAIVSRG